MQILKPVGYVHLHVHSSYSLLERAQDRRPREGRGRRPAAGPGAHRHQQPFGALEFSEKAAGSGIQPIAGMQLSVAFEAPEANAKLNATHPHIVVLAKDETGYGHLLRLASRAYFDNHLGEVPRVSARRSRTAPAASSRSPAAWAARSMRRSASNGPNWRWPGSNP